MTDQERIDVKDYIDARLTPIDREIKGIKDTLDTVSLQISTGRALDDRAAGGHEMKATIWRATAAIVTTCTAISAVVVAVLVS